MADKLSNSLSEAITNLTELTVTLKSGFTMRSWGAINAFKIGRIVILTFSGLASDSSITSDTAFCTISGITVSKTITGSGRCGTASIFMQSRINTGDLYINGTEANVACYGELVFFVN